VRIVHENPSDVVPIQRPITVDGSGGLQAADQVGDRRETLVHALADCLTGVAPHCIDPPSSRLRRDQHPLDSICADMALGRG
jgi:hypothetical protein